MHYDEASGSGDARRDVVAHRTRDPVARPESKCRQSEQK